MRHGSRVPLLIAATLGLLAVLLLWSRPARRAMGGPRAQARESAREAPPARHAAPGTVGAGLSEERGRVSFTWLAPEGPAARAGMRVGDTLVAVDGVEVRSRQEAEVRLRGTPGTPVRLRVRRGAGEHSVQLTRAD